MAGTDATSAALRGFTYQAVGQLASRAPGLFRRDASIAARFFAALSSEQAGVRAALQESVSSLASAYQGCTGGPILTIQVSAVNRCLLRQGNLCCQRSRSIAFMMRHFTECVCCHRSIQVRARF